MASAAYRSRLARSRLAPAAALPSRVRTVGRANRDLLRASARWLIDSRELTNFTYDLTVLNRSYMAWWVADLCGSTPDVVAGYFAEIQGDARFHAHIESSTRHGPRPGVADSSAKLARRLAWYAIARLAKPQHVVETGTDKGLGTCVFAAALDRNGAGRVTTIDINEDSGYLIAGIYDHVIDRRVGNSVQVLPQLADVDLFIHDSLHTYEYEMAELNAVILSPNALVLSDNAECTTALSDWSLSSGRRFSFFAEQPADHWYPGAGIGASRY